MDHPEGHGGTYTFSSATEKPVCKPESDSQNRVRRDGTVRYRERCETGLHPVSFAIQHIRREYNERCLGQMGGRGRHRRKGDNESEIRRRHNSNRRNKGGPDRNHGKSKENKRESRPISQCFKDEGHDYWRYWRGGSGRKNRGGGNEICISRSIDHQRWTMRQRDTQKNCNGQSRNGRTKNSMERQRDYASD